MSQASDAFAQAHGTDLKALIPVGGEPRLQRLLKITRTGRTTFEEEDLGMVMFVPLVGVNALYRWSSGEGQTSASYVVGRDTQKAISARIRPQVINAFKRGTMGTDEFYPVLGFKKQMEHAFAEDGVSESQSSSLAKKFYATMDDWLSEFLYVTWNSPEEFMSTIEAKMEFTISQMFRDLGE